MSFPSYYPELRWANDAFGKTKTALSHGNFFSNTYKDIFKFAFFSFAQIKILRHPKFSQLNLCMPIHTTTTTTRSLTSNSTSSSARTLFCMYADGDTFPSARVWAGETGTDLSGKISVFLEDWAFLGVCESECVYRGWGGALGWL